MHPAEPVVDRHEVSVAGSRISVLVAGTAGPQPPVLAIHGFGSSAAGSWQATGHLKALVRAGRQVIAPDLLGHGRSDTPTDPGAYSLAGLAALATAALEQLAGDDGPDDGAVDLLGYSLGARLCWEILATGSPWSRRPRRAVLGGFDGRALFDGVDEPALRAALGERSWPVDGTEPLAVQSLPPATRRIVDIIRAGRDVRPAALLAVVRGLSGAPVSAGSPVIPLLFAAGEQDPLATGARELAGRLPAGTFLPIPRRDHISAVPAGVFRAATVQFLADGTVPD